MRGFETMLSVERDRGDAADATISVGDHKAFMYKLDQTQC
jgi:hypothetical protein